MAIKTSEPEVERLKKMKKMKPNVHAQGTKIRRDIPGLEMPVHTLRCAFDAVHDPELKIIADRVYASGIADADRAKKTSSGIYTP